MPDDTMANDPSAPATAASAVAAEPGRAAALKPTDGSERPNGRAKHLKERWAATKMVLSAPRVRIELYGSDDARSSYRWFTARHPRIRIAANKRWGIALLALPATYKEYVDGRSRKALRQNCRRASQAGYRYEVVASANHLDDILEINRSAPERQGKPMRDDYTDAERVRRTVERFPMIHGILDAEGRLRAYSTMLEIGDAYMLTILIGHADALEHGVMYLLVSEMIRGCIDGRGTDGRPHWLMADTFWGAKRGLAYFKERCGFEPYNVKWVWLDNGPTRP